MNGNRRAGWLLGWAVFAVGVGAEAAGPDPAAGIRVLILEVPARELRVDLGSSRPLGPAGTGMIWEARPSMVRRLIRAASRRPEPLTLEAANALTPATIRYAAAGDRVDLPPNAGFPLAIRPIIESIEDGIRCAIAARPDGEGLAVDLDLADRRILEFESFGSPETPRGVAPPPAGRSVPQRWLDGLLGRGTPVVNMTMQVPVIHRGEVDGSWTIGPGRALVAGLGAYRLPGRRGGSGPLMERAVIVLPADLVDLDDEAARWSAPEDAVAPDRAMLAAGLAGVAVLAAGLVGSLRFVLRRTGAQPCRIRSGANAG